MKAYISIYIYGYDVLHMCTKETQNPKNLNIF